MKPRRMPFQWEGDLPKPGMFLCNSRRARVAYEIAEVLPMDPTKNKHRCNVRFVVNRWPLKEVPEHATVLDFTYIRRTK